MTNWRLGLVLGVVTFALGLAACSSDNGTESEEDVGILFPKDNHQQPDLGAPDGLDIVEGDGLDLLPTDLDAVGPTDLDIVEPDDADGITDPELPPVDGIEPELDVQQEDEEDPIVNYPFETYGPMTLSMKGAVIGGQFVQMRMAEVSYWKHPKENWEALMDLVVDAGFNGLYTSACWAHHERLQGQFDFNSENRDVASFLQLAHQKGLYVYFAAGPWIHGEAGGCLPDWLAAGALANASPVVDGQMALRVADGDFQAAVYAWFDQLNMQAALYQVTSFPQGPIVFYQVESNYDEYYFLKDANGKVQQEMLGVSSLPINIGLYMAQLRDAVQADGITAPLVTGLSGDFENGGRKVLGTGDTPGIAPAFELYGDSPYDDLENKLWSLRKEMRKAELHGQIYMAVPGIAIGMVPSAAHMARALSAGADVVVVKDFAASLLPGNHAAVGTSHTGIDFLARLDEAKVALGSSRRDLASPISLSLLPRKTFWAFKQLNTFLDLFGNGFAGKDLPHRTGANKSSTPLSVSCSNPAVGAIENKYNWPALGAAGGITEIFGDGFQSWFIDPTNGEPTGRSRYFFDTATGSVVLHLTALDELEDEANAHEPQDLITKVTVNGQEFPRHSNIIVPGYLDEAAGAEALGWGSKFIIVNYPLGIGYPLLEYSTSNLATLREFNGRLLVVAHGRPTVKSNGVYFTEPGELSLANLGGIYDVLHNSLPGGGIHTDAGGRLALTYQHDDTGYLVLQLASGKQLFVVSTTSNMVRDLHFHQKGNGYELAIFGFDRVDSVVEADGSLSISGKVSPPAEEFLILTDTEPYEVHANGEEVACEFEEAVAALRCQVPALEVPETIAAGDFYVRQENYNGSLSDIGATEYPDQFAQGPVGPLPADDAQVAASHGVVWYRAEVEIQALPPNQEGFFTVTGAADIVSLFVNGSYVGSAVPLGNVPMSATDVAIGLPTAGFRLPVGVLQQGTNSVAVRVVPLGRSGEFTPLVYASAPLLPPELDNQAGLLPHFAVEGLNPTQRKGLWGQVKLMIGALSISVNGPWTITRGDDHGLARSYGMLKNWHAMGPSPSEPTGYGFSWTTNVSEQSPLVLQDGQGTWLTTTFSSDSLGGFEGGLELALEGRSALAFVFFNGHFVGHWFSDEETFGQGLYSKLVQGAGTRQLLVDLDGAHFGSAERNRIALPASLMNTGGGNDNRVTMLFYDLSPALATDMVLPILGTVTGTGTISRCEVTWNQDNYGVGTQGPEAALTWHDMTLELLPPPPPPED